MTSLPSLPFEITTPEGNRLSVMAGVDGRSRCAVLADDQDYVGAYGFFPSHEALESDLPEFRRLAGESLKARVAKFGGEAPFVMRMNGQLTMVRQSAAFRRASQVREKRGTEVYLAAAKKLDAFDAAFNEPQMVALGWWLGKSYPHLFGPGVAVPLKKGIRQELAAVLPETIFSRQALREFLTRHTLRNAYQEALATGRNRTGLDGVIHEPPTDDERAQAAKRLQGRRYGDEMRVLALLTHNYGKP